MRRGAACIVALLVAFVLLQGTAFAAIPQVISFQGKLADAAGAPSGDAVDITFKLYPAATGGTQVWTETHAGVDPDDEGLFSVMLGSVTSFASWGVDFSQTLWLEVIVAGETLDPRFQLASVPYALAADDADTVDGTHAADLMDAATDDWVDESGDTMTGALKLTKITGSAASINFEMSDSTASTTTPVAIPDNNPAGVTDMITMPSLPGIEGLVVSISITGHSDIGELHVELTDPNATVHVLHHLNGSPATELTTSYPTPTALVSGDLSTWIGQDPAGAWTIKVIDQMLDGGGTDGQLVSWSIEVDAPSKERVVVSDGDLRAQGNVRAGGDLNVVGELRVQTGDLRVDAGDIVSPKWKVTHAIDNLTGPLPVWGSFSTSGGKLMIIVSGSGHRSPAGAIGMRVVVGPVVRGYVKGFTNEVGSHKAFVTNAIVVNGLAAGNHTVWLESWNSTSTDGNDFFTATVVEYPF